MLLTTTGAADIKVILYDQKSYNNQKWRRFNELDPPCKINSKEESKWQKIRRKNLTRKSAPRKT